MKASALMLINSLERMQMTVIKQGGHKPGKVREFEKLSKSQGKLREI